MNKCNGDFDCYGDRCPECSRFMDDCDGAEDYYLTETGEWEQADEN